jgi:radical SAM protein with 4Fe4S-binding SPASM domain
MAILSFDCEGNVSTFSPELLTVKHEKYNNFVFANVSNKGPNDPSTQLDLSQKFIDVCSEIQNGISKCRETCEYFAFCGGGAPSNKLHENGSFDSTKTLRCKLRVRALIDVCLEHLESKYGLDESQELPIVNRISKIREQADASRTSSLALLRPKSKHFNQERMLEQIHHDDFDDVDWDDIDWGDRGYWDDWDDGDWPDKSLYP